MSPSMINGVLYGLGTTFSLADGYIGSGTSSRLGPNLGPQGWARRRPPWCWGCGSQRPDHAFPGTAQKTLR